MSIIGTFQFQLCLGQVAVINTTESYRVGSIDGASLSYEVKQGKKYYRLLSSASPVYFYATDQELNQLFKILLKELSKPIDAIGTDIKLGDYMLRTLPPSLFLEATLRRGLDGSGDEIQLTLVGKTSEDMFYYTEERVSKLFGR